MKIHHATAKRAESLGLAITVNPDNLVIIGDPDGNVVWTGEPGQTGKEVLAAYEADDASYNEPDSDEPEDNEADAEIDAEGVDDGSGEFEPQERSIVKRKYRKLYHPKGRSCGDEMAQLLNAHLKDDDVLNVDRLIRFAKMNDCWVDTYASLNPGQIRMNVGNRLRAKVRKGYEPRWPA